MDSGALDFYAAPTPMSALPPWLDSAELPSDVDSIRSCVQGLLVHRDWVERYGIPPGEARLDEQQLRSVDQVLERARELSAAPLTVPRPPVERVLTICRHFALLHTAFLRANGEPARVRCGFGHYFDREKWHDHWITERWDGQRWVRDDPQIDDLQREAVRPDFDTTDQPPGHFLSGAQAWVSARAGDVDPERFGIFDMWGLNFIGGNVLLDLACLNKVELLPWDVWGLAATFGPYDAPRDDLYDTLDGLASLILTDDVAAIRQRYDDDPQLRVPEEFHSYVDGQVVPAHLPVGR